MEVGAFNHVFPTYSAIYETAVICAVIIHFTYETLWSIQSCPSPCLKGKGTICKKATKKSTALKSVLYSLTASM